MARKFLYVIAVLVALYALARIALAFWSQELTELAFVPDRPFEPRPALAGNAWQDPAMWIARPGLAEDPAAWRPEGAPAVPAQAGQRPVAVFFVHPTSYIDRGDWNARLDDGVARDRAWLFVKGMASPFAGTGQVWAPRYRQAAAGAFLTARPEAERAIDLAYGDVLAAFDAFARANPEGPVALAGHSQGAFLLRRLLRDRIAGTPLARRVVAAYVIGWPVSLEHDLPRMGLPACTGAQDHGCVLSWLTVADPADTAMLETAYARRRGLDGAPVGKSAFLCTDPLSGRAGGRSPASANLGTLVPDMLTGTGHIAPGVVSAACEADHFLHIGPPPALEMGPYVLPGNNYHLYDVTLFWANLQADFARRTQAWHDGDDNQ